MDLQPTCIKCGVALTLENMRALPDGKGFVCKDCYDAGGPRLTKSGFADVSPRNKPLREPNSLETTDDSKQIIGSAEHFFDLKEYVCHDCGYSFKKNPEFEVKVCPYCGKRGTVHQKVKEPATNFTN